jgi:hypothetical protein
LMLARVRDRERKWLGRATPAGQHKRRLEYQNARSSVTQSAQTAGSCGTASIRTPDPPRRSNSRRSHIIDRDPSGR